MATAERERVVAGPVRGVECLCNTDAVLAPLASGGGVPMMAHFTADIVLGLFGL